MATTPSVMRNNNAILLLSIGGEIHGRSIRCQKMPIAADPNMGRKIVPIPTSN